MLTRYHKRWLLYPQRGSSHLTCECHDRFAKDCRRAPVETPLGLKRPLTQLALNWRITWAKNPITPKHFRYLECPTPPWGERKTRCGRVAVRLNFCLSQGMQ